MRRMNTIDKLILLFIVLLVIGYLFNNPSNKTKNENGEIVETKSTSNFFDYARETLDRFNPRRGQEKCCDWIGTTSCCSYWEGYVTPMEDYIRNPPCPYCAIFAGHINYKGDIDWYFQNDYEHAILRFPDYDLGPGM